MGSSGARVEQIIEFLKTSGWVREPFDVSFLAAGEYNENYRVTGAETDTVFRINHGTQLGIENQMEYEFRVLEAISSSGVTPRPLRLCKRHELFPRGAMLMEFLPGRALDYRKDLEGAARCLAAVHSVSAPDSLIEQRNPVADILRECNGLLARYPSHPRSGLLPRIRRYAEFVEQLSKQPEADFSEETVCITNTEVNSGNFLVDDRVVRLVDWEKAVVSYRYQDLGHFLVPTTTLWKTDVVLDADARRHFLEHYWRIAHPPVSFARLDARTRTLEKTILLRAYSWCYMATAEYASGSRALTNEQTLSIMNYYLDNIDRYLGV